MRAIRQCCNCILLYVWRNATVIEFRMEIDMERTETHCIISAAPHPACMMFVWLVCGFEMEGETRQASDQSAVLVAFIIMVLVVRTTWGHDGIHRTLEVFYRNYYSTIMTFQYSSTANYMDMIQCLYKILGLIWWFSFVFLITIYKSPDLLYINPNITPRASLNTIANSWNTFLDSLPLGWKRHSGISTNSEALDMQFDCDNIHDTFRYGDSRVELGCSEHHFTTLLVRERHARLSSAFFAWSWS